MKKNNRGGSRPGSGRKKVKDKKKPLTIWVRDSEVKKAGGQDNAKKKAVTAITG